MDANWFAKNIPDKNLQNESDTRACATARRMDMRGRGGTCLSPDFMSKYSKNTVKHQSTTFSY